jgi:hypothetical protein
MAGLRLSGDGRRIENDCGQPVRLLGVNRSGTQYTCLAPGAGVYDGPVDQAQVTQMRTLWHITAVRVSLNEACWLGLDGVPAGQGGPPYRAAIAAYVELLTANGMAVVLDLHWNAPGTELADAQRPMPDRDHSPAFWASVAAAFAGSGNVLFEPYNEPYPDDEGTGTAAWTCWRDGGACPGVPFAAAGMQELVAAIRGTGARNLIVLTGVNWGSSLNQFLAFKPHDPLNRLVAGWHTYGDGLSCQTAACWDAQLQAVADVMPVIATELGEFDCGHGYLDGPTAWLNARGLHYLYWAWNTSGCRAEPALLAQWGSATETFPTAYGAAARANLLAQTP